MIKRKKLSYLFGLLVLLILMPGLSYAQTLRVEGRVLDDQGEGVIGAGVVIQGTTNGTVTDFDGKFVLPSVPAGSMLEISCVGYKTLQVAVTGTVLNVVLETDTSALDEAVVVAYGQQKKVTITGLEPVQGQLLIRFRDPNRNGRTGKFVFEGTTYDVPMHQQNPQGIWWAKVPLIRENFLDGKLELTTEVKTGPNLMIDRIVVLP